MPVTLVYGEHLSDFQKLGDQMLRDRGAQFIGDLGWALQTDDQGRERDEYDHMNPLYLILSDDAGDHVASTRLMSTTGPNMASDHFAHLTDGVAIESAAVWETTRFFVAQKAQRRPAPCPWPRSPQLNSPPVGRSWPLPQPDTHSSSRVRL